MLLKDGRQLIVKAIDHDAGISGLINYRIVSSLEPYFTVDYISGAVLTKAEIDFEKVGTFINIFKDQLSALLLGQIMIIYLKC